MNKRLRTYYKQGKKQIPLMALDRWILINKPVRLPIDIAEKIKCPHCGGVTLRTGNIKTVIRLATICGDVSVDQRWKSNIIRPLCGPESSKFDHETMLLMAWLSKNNYEPKRTFCAKTMDKV